MTGSSSAVGWLPARDAAPRFAGIAVVGILNVTPDSFSDGGSNPTADAAADRAVAMLDAGAAVIDVGGESTRPGSRFVGEAEELRRVIPAVEAILARRPEAAISVDTRKSAVARAALEAGARIVNDVSALADDPDMAAVCAESGAAVVLMHMQGTPATMQDDPRYADAVPQIADWLRARVKIAVDAGMERSKIIVDPGIGFGKRLEDNLALIARLDADRKSVV